MESVQVQAQEHMESVQAEQVQAHTEQVQAEQVQAEQVQAEQVQQEQIEEVPLKKYRAGSYDIHDETYANEMKKYSLPDEFHTFTDRLMDEPRINRYCLLNAIDEYNKTGLPKLPAIFQDTAYNCRPYQVCVIC